MRTIIIGFSKSKKFLPVASLAIRAYQNTPFSHVYIRLPWKGRLPSDKILHASEGLIQNMSGTQFDKKHEVVKEFELQVSDEVHKKLVHQMHELAGDNYSIMQNIGIIIVDIARFFKIRMTNPFKSGWNCSEFVMEIIDELFPNHFKDLHPNTVTPKEIYQIMLELCKQGHIKEYTNNYI